jgi:GMP synthase-like glutamine amidotransferase
LAFRHVPFEGLGYIETALESRGIGFDYCDLYLPGAQLPDPSAYSGLIFMGGPMSVNDGLPYLAEEQRLIQRAIPAGIPILGICLGSQLIAKALGARVYRNREKEIGWFDIQLTEAGRSDAVLESLGSSERLFHWHSETFELPQKAERLAWSERTPQQAFRYGGSVYALQFHLEVTPAMIAEWCEEDNKCGSAREVNAPVDPWINHERCLTAALAVFGAWCDVVCASATAMHR